jgi:hypothetical protein
MIILTHGIISDLGTQDKQGGLEHLRLGDIGFSRLKNSSSAFVYYCLAIRKAGALAEVDTSGVEACHQDK